MDLIDHLTKLLDQWERFESLNGDINYFSEILSPKTPGGKTLNTIRETFEDLKRCRDTLLALDKSCDIAAQAVSCSPYT
jgi:hypothetical protein